MRGRVTGTERTPHGTCGVHAIDLHDVSALAVGARVMRENRPQVTPGDELHAPHLEGHVVQRDPEVYRRGHAIGTGVRAVLMPRRGPAVVRRLEDGVVEARVHRAPAEELGGQLTRCSERGRPLERGDETGRPVDLGDLLNAGMAALVSPVETMAAGQLVKASEQRVEPSADGAEVGPARQALDDEEAGRPEGLNLARRQWQARPRGIASNTPPPH